MNVWLGSKYASVNITLHSTFLKRTVYRKLMKFFNERLYLKKSKMLRVHVKDKPCNSLIKKRFQNRCFPVNIL